MTILYPEGTWLSVATVEREGWPQGFLYYRGRRVASIYRTVTQGCYCLVLEGNSLAKVDGSTLLRVRARPPRKVKRPEQQRLL